MSTLLEIIDSANMARDAVYGLDSTPEGMVSFEGHRQPLEQLAQFTELKRYLPYQYYFEKHSVGTDPYSNAATIRHVDFESRGRGGLDFKLERIYSSLAVYAYKGEFLVNQRLTQFYQLLKSIVGGPEFKKSVMDWLFGKYRALLIDTRDLVSIYKYGEIGSPPSGPQYQDPYIFPDLDALIDSLPSGVYLSLDPSNYNLGIDTEHRLHRIMDLPGEALFDGTLLPPGRSGQYPPLPAIHLHLKYVVDDVTSKINRLNQVYDTTLALLEAYPMVCTESILGDGWTFNLPFIALSGQAIGQSRYIFFDGYMKEAYSGEIEKSFPEQKGYLLRLSSYPQEQVILQRFLEIYAPDQVTEAIGELEFRFRNVENRFFYFDQEGRLRFITDATHHNAIMINYLGGLISTITDAAGNVYTFTYSAKNKLEKISASYGKEIAYTVREVNSAEQEFILETVTEGEHVTSYRYQDLTVFSSPTTLDGSVSLQVVSQEKYPSGGVFHFSYYSPIFATVQVPFGRHSITQPDPDLHYQLAPPPAIERIYRNDQRGDILVGHPRIEEGLVSSLPWQPRFRKTVSVYCDHIVEHEFRQTYGEMKLFKKVVRALNWHAALEVSIAQYVDHLGQVLGGEMYRYFPGLLLEEVLSTTGASGLWLKRHFAYPDNPAIADSYGLPEEVIFTQEPGGTEVRRLHYAYDLHLPLLTAEQGDTRHIRYRYFYPADQDPAGCGKPTMVIEESDETRTSIATLHWYDRYGNLIQTRNAEGRVTRYEYAANNGQPETFLYRIIEEGRNG
jgi:hypothetical protein